MTWNSEYLYSEFRSEPYNDLNNNLIYSDNESYNDLNKNNKWDFGNLDNIEKFTVPYKNQEIDLLNTYDWESTINLLQTSPFVL